MYGLLPRFRRSRINRSLVALAALTVVCITAVVWGNSRELLFDISDPTPTITSVIPADHDKYMLMEVTAYCACKKCCGPNAIGLTASGKDVGYNAGKFVAADTNVLPFGTKLVIPGYDKMPVEVIDRGSAIKGNKLDVYFPTHEQAMQWGRRMVHVRIVD